MIKLIDSTLTMLDSCSITEEQIITFIILLKGLSIDTVVLSSYVYGMIAGRLPENITYYLELPHGAKPDNYPGIHYFISSYCDGLEQYIRNIQMNELSEAKIIARLGAKNKIRLTGLDDMLLYEDSDIYHKCMRQFADKTLILYPENAYYCASAIAVNYLLNNHNGIVMSTFHGIGNKAATEQVLLSMRVCKRYKINQSFEKLRELRELFEQMVNDKVSRHAPVIGEDIFHVESGIHVDGIVKKSSNYELYPPELVGAERQIILGKHSGLTSINYMLGEMNVTSCIDSKKVLERVKRLSIKKGRSLTKSEFRDLLDGCEEDETLD